MSSVVGRGTPFLTAEWRHLAMLNWPVSPDLVRPFVPAGTELDFHDGVTFVSVVGFLFLETRVLGVAVPWHRDFEEVNLRFYVRRVRGGEIRRGVTFLREFVPRRAIASLARWLYNEPYRCVPMSSRIVPGAAASVATHVSYRAGGLELSMETNGTASALEPGSLEAFIADHYWGYTPRRRGGTSEYRVAHPSWRIATGRHAALRGDALAAYGPIFGPVVGRPPASAFLADGSAIAVYRPNRVV